MVLGCYRALEYLVTRSDWDEKTLVVAGTSQGGTSQGGTSQGGTSQGGTQADFYKNSDQWLKALAQGQSVSPLAP